MAIAIHAILLLIGLSLLLLELMSYISSRRLIINGYRVEATVVKNIPSRSSDGGTMYTPMMTYGVNGKAETFSPNAKANPPVYNIGEKVTLIYDPNNARDLRIRSYWGIYLASNILLAFALPMLLIGGGYFLFKAGII